MKNTTTHSQKITKKLAKYGALSLAIAGISDLNGQIVYTDVDPDFVGTGSNVELDINNDGVPDFTIRDFNDYSFSSYPYPIPYIGILTNSSTNYSYVNSFIGFGFVGYNYTINYPYALNSGAIISSSATGIYGDWLNGYGVMNFNDCVGGFGSSNWCGVTDKYLGLRFVVDRSTHYGWARLDVDAAGTSYILKDYAYNTTPDEAILAGQQVLSLNDNQFSDIRISALNKTIAISNINSQLNYNLYSIAGKNVLNGNINDSTYAIEASGLSNGIYILELKDVNSDAVIRKKVML